MSRESPALVVTQTGPRLHKTLACIIVVSAGMILSISNGPRVDETIWPQSRGLYASLEGFLATIGGGPWLARMFSLACALGTILIVRSLTSHLFSRRVGILAAGMFGFTSSVLFVGDLASPDALTMLLLATALYVVVTQPSWETRTPAVPLLGLVYLLQRGTELATSRPMALDDVHLIIHWAWPIWVTAIVGLLVMIYERRWHSTLYASAFLLVAVAIPLFDVAFSDVDAFERHLGYSAVFLAPVSGWALARPWNLPLWTPPLIYFMAVASLWAAFRSYKMGL